LKRYCIEIAFDGTNYHGWQNQPNDISVQEVLEKNMSLLFQHKIILVGASRTDAGVHIQQTYAHFDTEKELPTQMMRRLNFMLPPDIAVKNLRPVSPTFHTRFDAIQRTYHYYICYQKNPFNTNRVYLYPYDKLNVEAMNEACAFLKTCYNFEAFCKRNADNKTTHCRIDFMQWTLQNDNELVFCVKADRYLRGMVKGLVGTMIKVGRGIYSLKDLEKLMASQDKSMVSFAVPGRALYLTEVLYGKEFYDIPVLQF
jgi:tRNA pseudouridine38-40 synthase